MKTILVTAFEPFGGDSVNASEAAVSALPESVGGVAVRKLLLPVAFGRAAEAAIAEAVKVGADAVLSIGQAAGRTAVTPETVAINLQYAGIPDNDGALPRDLPIDPEGREAFFSTLPARRMAEADSAGGVRAAVSYSAGTYVCNDLFYRLSARFYGSGVRVGFIHVPSAETLAARDASAAVLRAIEAIL